jgi:hypothetical protein
MREYREVRKDTPGDEAAPYIGVARTLLGVLKNRMVMGGIATLSSTTRLPDGAVITCMSVHGQDTIRIVPPPGATPAAPPQHATLPPLPAAPTVTGLVPTQACVWGPDIQTYSQPIPTYNTQYYPAVMTPQRDAMYLVTSSPGPVAYFNNNGPALPTNGALLIQLNPATLEVIGSATIDYPTLGGSPGIAADQSRNFVGASAVVPQQTYNVPDALTFLSTTSMWAAGGSPSEIIPPYNQTYPSTSGDVLQLWTTGTTFGAALAYLDQVTIDASGGGTNVYSTVAINPATGARTTLSWPNNSFISNTGVSFAQALANGNFLIVDSNGAVHLISGTGAQLQSWPDVPGFPVAVVMQGTTLFAQSNDGLYKDTGSGWELLQSLPGGPEFDIYAQALLVYDSVKDAVAFVSADGSGVTIYGGSDCMGATMGTNFVAFGNVPSFTQIEATQMENGTLLVTFGQGTWAGEAGGSDAASTVIVGRFDIGLLNQTVANGFQETS